MSKIEILPEELANQIAAGEVIERPASVVKELVENSLDAGASRLDIQVEGSGTRLIRIIDNGCGMDEDDVLLSLERHATSKLTRKEQLSSINTLGFRGEAIPTVASVARLFITSRTAGSSLGTRADIRYGELRKVHESGAVQGTVVEVRDLFGNVPARRKFLKTARTETNHIEEVVINTALGSIDLALTYELNGRRIHSFPANETLGDRLRRVMNIRDDGNLMEIRSPGQGGNIKLAGYLLPPEQSRAGGGRLRLFVNRRPVQDRMISHAVAEGMQGFLMKGRRPSGVLFVSLPPDQVDVNVHPAKHEVRFPKPHIIHQIVVQGVRSALEDYQNRIKSSVFSSGPEKEESRQQAGYPERRQEMSGKWKGQGLLEEKGSFIEAGENSGAYFQDNNQDFSFPQDAGPQATDKIGLSGEQTPESFAPPAYREDFSLRGSEDDLNYIGQFRNSYLLCESRQGLVVIDQHAAHERLLFESLKKQYSEAKLSSQSLLFPEVMECDHEQERVLEDYQEEIERLGFEIAHFGGKSYAIKAVPAILVHLSPLEAVAGLFSSYLEQLQAGGKGPSRLEDVLAGMACKAAVKANHHLQDMEGEELLKRMQEADIFSHCPHGRPVLRQFSDEEIKKWFYRT